MNQNIFVFFLSMLVRTNYLNYLLLGVAVQNDRRFVFIIKNNNIAAPSKITTIKRLSDRKNLTLNRYSYIISVSYSDINSIVSSISINDFNVTRRNYIGDNISLKIREKKILSSVVCIKYC